MVCSGSLCGPTSHRDGEASALNQQLHSCTRVHAVEGPDKTCMARLFVRPLILGSASPRSLAMTNRTSPERRTWARLRTNGGADRRAALVKRAAEWRYMLMWPACWSKEMYTVHTGRRRALIKEREGARAGEGTRCILDTRCERSRRSLLSWVLSKVGFRRLCWLFPHLVPTAGTSYVFQPGWSDTSRSCRGNDVETFARRSAASGFVPTNFSSRQLGGVGVSPPTFTVLWKMQKGIVELWNWLIPG